MRSDCCTFQRLGGKGGGSIDRISSIIILYVDDMLWAADKQDEKSIDEMLKDLVVGEIFFLSPSRSVDFLGATIAQHLDKRIGLHMNGFLSKLEEVAISDVCRDGKFTVDSRRLETLARQIVGSLLRAGQLHFSLGFDLAILSTTIKQFSVSTENAKAFLLRSNRMIRGAKKRMGVSRYVDFLGSMPRTSSIIKENMTLFLLTDAGYASLAVQNLLVHFDCIWPSHEPRRYHVAQCLVVHDV